MDDSTFDALVTAQPGRAGDLVRALDPGELTRASARHGEAAARLSKFERLTGQQDREFTAAMAVMDAVGARRDEQRDQVRGALRGGHLEHGAYGDAAPAGPAGVFGEAHRCIDTAARAGLVPDYAAHRATMLVDRGNLRDRSVAAQWAARAGDPHYGSAFAKMLADPERGHLMWTEQERRAFAAVQEFRAASLTDSAGGYMVPFHLDPSILLTNDGSINPLRQISRTVTITSDVWNGVTSAGVTASWDAEATEVSDDTPTLGSPTVPVYKGQAFVPFSFEIGQDAQNFAAEMGALLADSADQLQATAYATGSGSGQPTGLITALVASSPTVIVNSTGSNTFTSPDVYALQAALPPRWQARARWGANVAIINAAAAFESTNGARLFPETGSASPSLLRKPLHEISSMDGTFGSGENYALVYGDFSQFLIVDRIGTTIELVPHLVGSNRRPTGQRGFLLWFRTGSDVLVDSAFRLLDIT